MQIFITLQLITYPEKNMSRTSEGIGLYQKIIETRGGSEGCLLEVLEQALHHNLPNSFHLGIAAGVAQGGIDGAFYSVTQRVALVNRHITDAQTALHEIYTVAKSKGYKEIIDVFERTYHIGH